MTRRVTGAFEESSVAPLTSADITLPAMDFVVQWARCGMTADYIADYLSYAFERRASARSIIATAANELLENAAKFSVDKREQVRIHGRLRGSDVQLEVENVTDEKHLAVLERGLAALHSGDPAALFAQRVESSERGGLGLIILAKDYGARLGVRAVAAMDGAFRVTVRASISADDVEAR
jgi:hypothetical protein